MATTFFPFFQILDWWSWIFFWKSEAKRSKLCKSKVVQRKHFGKCFWSYPEVKNECFEPLKITFFRYLQIFERRSWNYWKGDTWEGEKKCQKLFKSKISHRKLFKNWFWRYFEVKSKCSKPLNIAFFSFLHILKWRG